MLASEPHPCLALFGGEDAAALGGVDAREVFAAAGGGLPAFFASEEGVSEGGLGEGVDGAGSGDFG